MNQTENPSHNFENTDRGSSNAIARPMREMSGADGSSVGIGRIQHSELGLPNLPDRYRLERVIGRGGMSTVVAALDARTNQRVAIKLLRPEFVFDQQNTVRLFREARAASSLNSPHVVKLIDFSILDSAKFLVLEYIEGVSLADHLRHGRPLQDSDAREIMVQLLRALETVHSGKLIHRDVKPSNILLSRCNEFSSANKSRDGECNWELKLADFGLAVLSEAEVRLTNPGIAVGTPEYMSPEAARGDLNVSYSSDLFSAGVVLYQMLTGISPFRKSHTSATLNAISSDQPVHPKMLNPTASPDLCELAMRLINKDPAHRPTSAADSLALLRKTSLAAKRETIPRVVTLRIAAGAIAAAIGLIFFLGSGLQNARQPIIQARMSPDNTRVLQVVREGDAEWQHFATLPKNFSEDIRHVMVLDSDGDHKLDMVVAAGNSADGPELIGFKRSGKIGWEMTASRLAQWSQFNFDEFEGATWKLIDGVPPVAWNPGGTLGEDLLLPISAGTKRSRVLRVRGKDGVSGQIFQVRANIEQVLVVPPCEQEDYPSLILRTSGNDLTGWAEIVQVRSRFALPQPCEADADALIRLDPANMAGTWPPEWTRWVDEKGAVQQKTEGGAAKVLTYAALLQSEKLPSRDECDSEVSEIVHAFRRIHALEYAEEAKGEIRVLIGIDGAHGSHVLQFDQLGWLTMSVSSMSGQSLVLPGEAPMVVSRPSEFGWRQLAASTYVSAR